MKIILLTDVPKVGNRYDILDLKEGYAQNVFLSKGLAVLATPAELAKLADKKNQIEKKKKEEMDTFLELISKVNGKAVTIKAKANDKGHLFKAVSPHDVAQAVKKETGIDLDEKSLRMDHIKTTGMHSVLISKSDKKGECRIIVEAE